MSLSKPKLSNPSSRWIEWKGSTATLRYYDKEKKAEIVVPQPFTFILLDELSCVTGYVKKLESNVFSNEVRDTTKDAMIVKAHKGGVIVEGLYRDIKERLPKGASFCGSCYIGYKDESGQLSIGNIKMAGASLSPWIEFKNTYRNDFGKKAITINGFTDEKNGDVEFKAPKFFSTDISPATIQAAIRLDLILQGYLDSYVSQSAHSQAQPDEPDEPEGDKIPMEHENDLEEVAQGDIPF